LLIVATSIIIPDEHERPPAGARRPIHPADNTNEYTQTNLPPVITGDARVRDLTTTAGLTAINLE
jgi:hypothetical protein